MESYNLEALTANPSFSEELFNQFSDNPEAVADQWKDVFRTIGSRDIHYEKPTLEKANRDKGEGSVLYYPKLQIIGTPDQKISNLIQTYRTYGHLMAHVNPLEENKPEEPWQLSLEQQGFTKQDLTKPFPTLGLLDKDEAPLIEIIQQLKSIYCDKIGYEFTYLQNPEIESWIQNKLENPHQKDRLTIEQKKIILQNLNKSELFENFLHTKYTGQKRFSLEGGETLIPMLAMMIEKGADLGIEEYILGMAHRGRLNVLTNILNKSYSQVFYEFEDSYIPGSFEGSGDVKYHKGFSAGVTTSKEKFVNIFLSPNPSHLEAVNPVVEGIVRGKQFLRRGDKAAVMPVLIHGDAALSGQGIVYETLQLCKLPGYSTCGTLHFVINNQIGFTTIPEDSRSTKYCTDIAKTFGAPVFHVNAEDPESCVLATLLALELRLKFQCDVFIDLVCYRKYGHNESDEPAFTQPVEYKIIRSKQPIREIYRDALILQGVVERKVAEALEAEFNEALQSAHLETKNSAATPKEKTPDQNNASSFDPFEQTQTGVSEDVVQTLAQALAYIPEEFQAHKKLYNLHQDRKNSLLKTTEDKSIDWGTAEILAYATLLNEGINIRVSGQDVQRGTFSHRHAVLIHQEHKDKPPYIPLQNLSNSQGIFQIYNSSLSEYAILGFEYGYSIARLEDLTIWEAQFGDFSNGAQVIIDQFIATAEQKWGQKAPVVLLLPHGYEGQGPEHSSARMERFLALSGDNNWRVAYPSTPAQMYHLLRSQALAKARKPLIVFTPKGLLRHPRCLSSRADLIQGSFQTIIEDPSTNHNAAELFLCTGRIYYDIKEEIEKLGTQDAALVRVEQLYPLHTAALQGIFKKMHNLKTCCWVQEEPCNMGAWDYIHPQLQAMLPSNVPLKYIGRARSSSPAAGSYGLHKKQHRQIIEELQKLKESHES